MTALAENIPNLDARSIIERAERIEKRNRVLASTFEFARVTGNNSYNPAEDCYPWLSYLNRATRYIDRKADGVAKPVKLVFVARGHLKTVSIAHALARYTLLNPERRSAIISATDEKAEQNLNLIKGYLTDPDVQDLFPDILYPNEQGQGKYYTKSWLKVKRQSVTAEPTISAFGYTGNFAGKHYNGVIWVDDIVTENNAKNPEVQKDIWRELQHLIQFVAVSGCEIWISGTRYNPSDAYSYILDPSDKFHRRIIPGHIDMGCYEDPDTRAKELFSWRYCVEPEDKNKEITYEGKTYKPVRESLKELEEETDPEEWWAQMMNSPISGHNPTFRKEDFNSIIPCSGDEFDTWIKNNGAFVCAEEPERGMIDTVVVGDYAYSDRTHNDYSVTLLVSQDTFDHWYVRKAKITRDGWKGLKRHLQEAYAWKQTFGVSQFGIEFHAKEALRALAKEVEKQMGVTCRWNDLKINSREHKVDRIAIALEDLVRDGRLHFCEGSDVAKFREMITIQALQFPSKSSAKVHDDCLDALANCRAVFRIRHGKENSKQIRTTDAVRNMPLRLRKWVAA